MESHSPSNGIKLMKGHVVFEPGELPLNHPHTMLWKSSLTEVAALLISGSWVPMLEWFFARAYSDGLTGLIYLKRYHRSCATLLHIIRSWVFSINPACRIQSVLSQANHIYERPSKTIRSNEMKRRRYLDTFSIRPSKLGIKSRTPRYLYYEIL